MYRVALALAVMASSGTVSAQTAAVRLPAPAPRAPSDLRLKPVTAPANPQLQLDGPQSMLKSGYGGSIVDLFPFEGGKFHISGGGRLFGRPGRPRSADPESMRYLPASRAGSLRSGRRLTPALLVGYGHTVERGLALGVDAGMVMGRLGAMPDRFGRLNRRRLDSVDGRGSRRPTNPIARMTALYRF